MRTRFRTLQVVITAVTCALCLGALAALRMCPDCGWEVEDGAGKCGHCGRAMAPVPAASAAPDTAPAAATPAADAPAGDGKVADEVMNEQLRQALAFEKAGDLQLAMLYARNALALLALAGPERGEHRARMSTLIAEGRQKIIHRLRPCPVCEGTGLKKMRVVSMSGELLVQDMPGSKCAACEGRGRIPGLALESETAGPYAEAQRQFKIQQQRRGFEEAGGVWLPAGLATAMSARQTAALRKAFGVPCAICSGLGRQACETCTGKGLVKCENEDCKEGIETCRDCGGKGKVRSSSRDSNLQTQVGGSSSRFGSNTRGTTVTLRTCATCNGAGKRVCQDCGGQGMVTCSACEGRSEKVCRSCKGTGDAPLCSKCQGEGYATCSRCAGTGTYRNGPCTYCRGEGGMLCTTCQGTGRTSRR